MREIQLMPLFVQYRGLSHAFGDNFLALIDIACDNVPNSFANEERHVYSRHYPKTYVTRSKILLSADTLTQHMFHHPSQNYEINFK